jgi:hypothetical protein
MKLIPSKKLNKGKTYYIECTFKTSGHSGKIIGIFEKFVFPCGENPPFAEFRQLTDVPHATMPSGMGLLSTNYYSTLCHKFWLLQEDVVLIYDKTNNSTGTSYYSSD